MSIGRRISVKKAKGKHKCHAVNLSFLAENIATQPSLAGDWAELDNIFVNCLKNCRGLLILTATRFHLTLNNCICTYLYVDRVCTFVLSCFGNQAVFPPATPRILFSGNSLSHKKS